MLRSRIHNAVIAGALAIAMALTGVAGAAFAQEAATSTEQPAVNGIAPSTPVNPQFGGRQRMGWSGPLVTRVANILKMSVEDVIAQRQAGKSFAEIAQEKGTSEADLLAALVAEVKSSVESLVASGNMTQAQADRVLANVEANLKAAITRTAVGPRETASAQAAVLQRARQGRTGGSSPQVRVPGRASAAIRARCREQRRELGHPASGWASASAADGRVVRSGSKSRTRMGPRLAVRTPEPETASTRHDLLRAHLIAREGHLAFPCNFHRDRAQLVWSRYGAMPYRQGPAPQSSANSWR